MKGMKHYFLTTLLLYPCLKKKKKTRSNCQNTPEDLGDIFNFVLLTPDPEIFVITKLTILYFLLIVTRKLQQCMRPIFISYNR